MEFYSFFFLKFGRMLLQIKPLTQFSGSLSRGIVNISVKSSMDVMRG